MGDIELSLRSMVYDTMDDARLGDLYLVNDSLGNFMFVATFLEYDVSRDRNTTLVYTSKGLYVVDNLSGEYSRILSRVDASDG